MHYDHIPGQVGKHYDNIPGQVGEHYDHIPGLGKVPLREPSGPFPLFDA